MMALNPGRPISPDRVLGFADAAATNAWLQANPERVLGGVHFSEQGARAGPAKSAPGTAAAASMRLQRVGIWGAGGEGAVQQGSPLDDPPSCSIFLLPCPAAGGRFDYLLQVNTSVRYFKDKWIDPNFYYQASWADEEPLVRCAWAQERPCHSVPRG